MSSWPSALTFIVLLSSIDWNRCGVNPATVPEQTTNIISTPEDNSETVCLDFLGILIDHLLGRITMHLKEPAQLPRISNSFFTLEDGLLYGMKGVRRTCPITLGHEEMWLRANESMPNQEVRLPGWMQKRDTKLADVIHLTFCLGIPDSLQLRGSMAVSMFWTNYDPEQVRITLSDISIRANLRMQLNTTGNTLIEVVSMQVEKFGGIRFEQEELQNTRDSSDENHNGFLAQYASWADWLANGPLYTPLVIVLETLLKDSFSAILKEKQSNW